MVDDDCDGLIDCFDPDCTGVFPCPRARNNPALIRFGRSGRLDQVSGHAVLDMAPVNLTTMAVAVLLSNRNGSIYSGELPAGALSPRANGRLFQFRNRDARAEGGIYRVMIRKNQGNSYTFNFTSYGDLSAATDPNMRLQFYIGNDEDAAREGRVFITIDAPWRQTPFGWNAPRDH
jgi:hypothetical protein